MPFRFYNSRLAATLLLSLVLAFGSTAMAGSAAKKVSIIFADSVNAADSCLSPRTKVSLLSTAWTRISCKCEGNMRH